MISNELSKFLCVNMKEFGNVDTAFGLMECEIILSLIIFISIPSLILEVRV